MKTTIEETKGLSKLELIDPEFSFVLENYQVTLKVQEQSENRTGFYLDMDGQHFEEDKGVFYRNTDFIAKDFRKRLIEKCSDNKSL